MPDLIPTNIKLTAADRELLESLASSAGCSMADIVRRSVRLLDTLEHARSQGDKLMIVSKGGKSKQEIVLV